MGVAPEPYYDPLAFAVEEAHRRGVELHAWFNPFRARHFTSETPASDKHVSVIRPDLVRSYGDQLWLDPGDPLAREHSLSVILDVVKRYDIDGVHLDDYFYPYEVEAADGSVVDFPDDSTWSAALETGLLGASLATGRRDWRRSNVDRFVEDLYAGIKQAKPWVRFGIAPFGIWRPGHPPQIQGFDPYEKIYADARKWLVNGWVDYFTPQLYWKIDPPQQSYPVLLDWWLEQNPHGRHIWPGNYASRAMMKGRDIKALMRDSSGLSYELADRVYGYPALVPETSWLGGSRPPRPDVAVDTLGSRVLVEMSTRSVEPWLWVVRTLVDGRWNVDIVPGWKQLAELPGTLHPDAVVVSAVSRLGLEGPAQRAKIRTGP
jgi:uncharacterized lipoprotein YddW (UPF0748 family)